MQAATFQPLTLPHPIYTEGKALGSEITRLCAHIHAATC
jgi:hypothetical protein